MGLYIPGTSIRGCGVGGPIGCGCPCYNPYNGRCQVVNKDVGDPSVLGFPDFCPIVRVQSPHGRLIDTSAKVLTQLYDDEHETWSDEVELTVEQYLGYCFNEVPTIIPADPAKEG